MSKTFKIVGNDISDGYHTFSDLYEHRCLLYLNWCLEAHEACCWRPDFEGWFVLYRELPEGQMSYHLPNNLLPIVERCITRNDKAKFDGHTGKDVLNRMLARAEEKSRSLEKVPSDS